MHQFVDNSLQSFLESELKQARDLHGHRLMLTHENYLELTLGKLAAGIGHP